jgi:hypothetical protein
MQHQPFDAPQGYPGMQYGQQNVPGMPMQMQQQNRGPFSQSGPPGSGGSHLRPSGQTSYRFTYFAYFLHEFTI